ncbi:MAG: hypothetical protein K2M08_04385 [Anaeroplasmataceae bacterium]|nr:hypothetical protein [Anaeroplasmataceae bacterium]
MKYMSFNSSCTLTALANMLELLKIDNVTDRILAEKLMLPYIFRYKENQFCAGAMNQNAEIYNSYFNKKGYEFVEVELSKEELWPYLKKHPISMLGVKSVSGKHAVVFLKQQEEELLFLNPHYENDKEKDILCIKKEELNKFVENKIIVGSIQKGTSQQTKIDYQASLKALDVYLREFDTFCCESRSRTAIFEKRDELFRCFAIDLIPMMEILKENTLLSLLYEFQQVIFKLIKIEDKNIPYNIVSKSLVERIVEEYRRIIMTKLKGENL